MEIAANQMLEARASFGLMLRRSALPLALLLTLIAGVEFWLSLTLPVFALGFCIGCLYAAANVALLFWFLAPYFFFGEKALYVLLGVVISLAAGGALMFVATYLDQKWAMGLALGMASPLVFATTSKSEKR